MIFDPKQIARKLEQSDWLLGLLTSDYVLNALMRHPKWKQAQWRSVHDEQRRLKQEQDMDPDAVMRRMNGAGGV